MTDGAPASSWKFWLTASLLVCVAFAVVGEWPVLGARYVVQDDARQHVVWLSRFTDPALFPNDPMAAYFGSVAPVGFLGLYRLVASLGLDALPFHLMLPPVLALVTTVFIYSFHLAGFGGPVAGFLATLFLNLNLWLKDDLSTATPRAFVYPVAAIFLDCLVRDRRVGVLVACLLQGLLFPPMLPVLLVALFLQTWRRGSGWRWFIGTAVACGVLLALFSERSGAFGPVVSVAEARLMPEFGQLGRQRFFVDDAWSFWLIEERSGFLPREWWFIPVTPPHVWIAAVGIVFLVVKKSARPTGFRPLVLFLLVSTGMFLAAHALLFKLYLPSRFSQHSLRLAAAIVAGFLVALMYEKASSVNRRAAMVGLVVVTLGFLAFPLWLNARVPGFFPRSEYVVGRYPDLYEFFQKQPKDILIASLSEEANNFPAFGKRSILTGRECAIAYHTGYYNRIRQRTLDLIRAQYSPDPNEVRAFVRTYGVTHFVVDRRAFTPEYLGYNTWLHQYQPAFGQALEWKESALGKMMGSAVVHENDRFLVVDAARLPTE